MRQYFQTKWVLAALGLFIFVLYILSVFWSIEPSVFDVEEYSKNQARQQGVPTVTGYAVTTALIRVSETLLDKSGGYLSNDVILPSVMMDNMPSWEFGVLEMTRDLSLAMRKDFSRSQSQSVENSALIEAHTKFNIDSRSWILPSSESSYRDAIELLYTYRDGLANISQDQAQFYARADNLRDWMKQVEKRMGSLSQRLSVSVGQQTLNTDLAGDTAARQSTPTNSQPYIKTSWWKLDDNFYEARGASWALLHFLKAIQVDFADVLEKKNASVSLKQIIRELEATQQTLWSPMVLNGDGFGMLANHSLVMANYISRANAALIDLSELLSQG